MITREMRFLDGSVLCVREDVCRGCLMNQMETTLPKLIEPIYDDGEVVVRQDAEWPVPGFYIVGLRQHLGAIDRIPVGLYTRLCEVTREVRSAMRTLLGVEHCHFFQEEKLVGAHYHAWLLPLWPNVMKKHEINPRVYESNIAAYLQLFDLEGNCDLIHDFNVSMSNHFHSFRLNEC